MLVILFVLIFDLLLEPTARPQDVSVTGAIKRARAMQTLQENTSPPAKKSRVLENSPDVSIYTIDDSSCPSMFSPILVSSEASSPGGFRWREAADVDMPPPLIPKMPGGCRWVEGCEQGEVIILSDTDSDAREDQSIVDSISAIALEIEKILPGQGNLMKQLMLSFHRNSLM